MSRIDTFSPHTPFVSAGSLSSSRGWCSTGSVSFLSFLRDRVMGNVFLQVPASPSRRISLGDGTHCWELLLPLGTQMEASGYLSPGYLPRKVSCLGFRGWEVPVMPDLGLRSRGRRSGCWSPLAWGVVSQYGSQQASLQWLQQGWQWAPSGQVSIFSQSQIKTCSAWQSDGAGQECWNLRCLLHSQCIFSGWTIHKTPCKPETSQKPSCKAGYCSAFFI